MFDPNHTNQAELGRRTDQPSKVLTYLKKNGFIVKTLGFAGCKAKTTELTGYTRVIDKFIRNRISSSEVVCDWLR